MLKQVNTLTSRQVEKRSQVLKTLQKNMVHVPERDERHVSPCGRYMVLEKSYVHKDKGYWGYTEGVATAYNEVSRGFSDRRRGRKSALVSDTDEDADAQN
jgi:hypothetical protein